MQAQMALYQQAVDAVPANADIVEASTSVDDNEKPNPTAGPLVAVDSHLKRYGVLPDDADKYRDREHTTILVSGLPTEVDSARIDAFFTDVSLPSMFPLIISVVPYEK